MSIVFKRSHSEIWSGRRTKLRLSSFTGTTDTHFVRTSTLFSDTKSVREREVSDNDEKHIFVSSKVSEMQNSWRIYCFILQAFIQTWGYACRIYWIVMNLWVQKLIIRMKSYTFICLQKLYFSISTFRNRIPTLPTISNEPSFLKLPAAHQKDQGHSIFIFRFKFVNNSTMVIIPL